MLLCLRRQKMSPSTSTVRRDLMSVILNTLFPNLSRKFLTNIDWLLQLHGSIGHFDWLINPTLNEIFKSSTSLQRVTLSRAVENESPSSH